MPLQSHMNWHNVIVLYNHITGKRAGQPTLDHKILGSNSAGGGNSTHECTVLYCIEPFIITLPSSLYDLK